ncbi:MAG TPA: kelch repeat-containing protein [Blastocatellia bacterium]|nr:kelch repeat-containing protein [Blastocatellia bacterium]
MRKHWKRWLRMFLSAWLAGAATVTLVIAHYAAEDFTLPDLLPMFLTLAAGGALLTAAVSLPVLLPLSRRGGWAARLSPAVNALLFTLLAATATGLRAFVFDNLPVGEAVTFTAAFAMMGLASGLAFIGPVGESRMRRRLMTLAYLLLMMGALAATTFTVPFLEEALLARAANGTVTRVVTMAVPRSAHTATLLADGRVLLAGGMVSVRGDEVATASTEIYDPRTGTLREGGRLTVPRAGHTATLLKDGNVLITGGGSGQENLSSAELYRVAAGDSVPVGPMRVPRERHAATMLADGRVLVTGGTIVSPSDESEIYDPDGRAFLAGPRMQARRAAHSATLLADGRVLIAGGTASPDRVLRSVEIYDPAGPAFGAAGQMLASRYKHSAVRLGDGKVLVLGGSDERDWDGRRQSVEIYDPVSRLSQFVAPLNRARFKFPNAVAATPGGGVIVGGGGRRVEVFDRAANRFALSGGSVEDEWFYATATPLADGRVLIAGGYNSSLYPTNQAWIYQPPAANRRLALRGDR